MQSAHCHDDDDVAMGVGASTMGVDAITGRGLEPIFLFISYAKGKCVYFWTVKPHKHY